MTTLTAALMLGCACGFFMLHPNAIADAFSLIRRALEALNDD